MGVEQLPAAPKPLLIRRGYPIAAVLTGDVKDVDQKRAGRNDRSPLQLGQMTKHLPRTFPPLETERGEIGVVFIKPAAPPHFEAVSLVTHQVYRHAY